MKKIITIALSMLFYILILQLLSNVSILSNPMFYITKKFYIGSLIIIVSVVAAH